MIFMKNAARAGSRGGERANRITHVITAGPSAQPRCAPMPDHGATAEQRAEQLRLFALDGAWAEPYVPARVGNGAAMSAALRVGRAQ